MTALVKARLILLVIAIALFAYSLRVESDSARKVAIGLLLVALIMMITDRVRQRNSR